MRSFVILAAVLATMATPVLAKDVKSLIKSNSETLTQSTEQIKARSSALKLSLSDAAIGGADLPAVTFWPHLRGGDYRSDLRAVLANIVDGVEVNGSSRAVDLQQTQVLDFGPNQSQIRFFKEADADSAKALQGWLARQGLAVEIVNLTERYKDQSWIKVGHFELWVAPGAF